MPPPPPAHTIHLIPPPTRSILPAARQLCLISSSSPSSASAAPAPPSPSPSSPPPTLLSADLTAAIQIRTAVFVDEQGCDAREEIDDDDGVSWGWVVYVASPASASPNPAAPRTTTTPRASVPPTATPPSPTTTPAATIRLVPVHGSHGGDAHWVVRPGWGRPDYGASGIWDGREGYVKIGRLATMRGMRGQGWGRVLVEEVVGWAGRNPGLVGRGVRDAAGEEGGDGEGEWKGLIGCHAQSHLEGWYAKLGFVRDEGMGEWEEDGIPHVGMWRRVEF